MKKKIFNPGLYREGLRQLKLIGILVTVVLCFAAIIFPVAEGISSMRSINAALAIEPSYISNPEVVDGLEMNPLIIGVFYLIAPVMVFALFAFLNKRKTSDFYHSIPHTRLSLFLSFYAAIMTWVAIMIVSSTVCATVCFSLFPKVFTPNYLSLILFALSSFLISLLSVGGTLVAMTITGSPMINVLIAAIVLYLPRITIAVINTTLRSNTPMLTSGHMLPILDNGYNLLTTIATNAYTVYISLSDIVTVKGLVYTSVVGLLLTALAAVLFVKRKSESAERSAPSKKLQATYRIIVTMIVCLFACYMIFSAMCGGTYDLFETVIGIVIIYIVALIVYFSYELITTKKWKNLLKAIPGLAIVALCNFLLIGGLSLLRTNELKFSPSADEIKSIGIVYDDEYYGYYSNSYYDYVQTRLGTIKLDDSETKTMVADALSSAIQNLKENGVNRYSQKYYSYIDPETGKEHNYTRVSFKIETKSTTKYRTLFISDEENAKLNEKLLENKQYYDFWMNIPELLSESSIWFRPENDGIDNPSYDWMKVYNTAKAEIAALDPQVWIAYNDYSYSWEHEDTTLYVGDLHYSAKLSATESASINIPIYAELMPKTAALCLEASACKLDYVKNKISTSLAEMKWANYANITTAFIDPESKTVRKFSMYRGEYGNDAENKEIKDAIDYLVSKSKEYDGTTVTQRTVIHMNYACATTESGYSYETYNGLHVSLNLSGVSEEELTKLGFVEMKEESGVFPGSAIIID